ncbi:MAG TPA: DUF4405 domain-containing protein [Gemmatimonadales bacterium]|jgi:hypothetical protein|nr:DUF4405 domain-containing protein [Gemmatimonadales bacterium]
MRRARFLFWLDLLLLLTFALLQEPETTGLWGHEWISIGLSALLFLHLLVNWRWIAGALKRYGTARRRARVNAWLNGLLYVTMVFTIFSGLVVSQFVLPAVGLEPSALRAWRQLHAFVAGVTLVIVGLHVAVNWDWIANVVRRWRGRHAHPEPSGGRTLAQRLGLEGARSTVGRLGRLVAATALVCALSYLPVAALARARDAHELTDRWKSPDFGDIPGEVTVQLLVVVGAAAVGRYVLKIKL